MITIADMYGRIFESMFEGSMIGKGALVFAVWSYVIAKQKPDAVVGSQVSLNPALVAMILGEKERDVEEVIRFLCAPDPKSTTKVEQGRRLKRLGEFDYQVVNGAMYQAIRDEEERRKQNREAQARYRDKQKVLKGGKPQAGEMSHETLVRNGASEAECNRVTESTLPEPQDYDERPIGPPD